MMLSGYLCTDVVCVVRWTAILVPWTPTRAVCMYVRRRYLRKYSDCGNDNNSSDNIKKEKTLYSKIDSLPLLYILAFLLRTRI